MYSIDGNQIHKTIRPKKQKKKITTPKNMMASYHIQRCVAVRLTGASNDAKPSQATIFCIFTTASSSHTGHDNSI